MKRIDGKIYRNWEEALIYMWQTNNILLQKLSLEADIRTSTNLTEEEKQDQLAVISKYFNDKIKKII